MKSKPEFDAPIIFSAAELSAADRALDERARGNAASYRGAEALLLADVMEVDRTRLYEKLGLKSTFSYCETVLKLSRDVACNFIAVARRAERVPQLKIAIDEGALSVSKARKIAPILTPENGAEWIAMAMTLPQHQLEREVAEYAPEISARAADRARPIFGRRVHIQAIVSEGTFDEIRHAQNLASESLGHSASLGETFRETVQVYLDQKCPARRAARSMRRAESRKGKKKSSQDDSRRAPLATAVRRAVDVRDERECQALLSNGEKCRSKRFLHRHHVIEVARGGTDDPANLITLCGSCHRRWHEQKRQSSG